MGKSLTQFYDVIVVGAGPAGATLAYELANKKTKVLLLDKEGLPRYKACAGGINVRAVNLLPFDISSVVERVTYGARISYKLNYKVTRFYDKPLTYMVMRDKFDHFLNERAQDAGAELLDNQKVVQLKTEASKVKVHTENHAFVADIVVGADGANSIVARCLGLMGDADYNIGLEGEVYVNKDELSKWDGLVGVDIENIFARYGWLFPKENHLSIGVAGPIHLAKNLRPYFKRLLQSYNLANYEIRTLKGAFMPLRNKGTHITCGRGLLIGDAAGLIDGLTGEGIYYAIRSAQLAGPVINDFLGGKLSDLQEYEKVIDSELMPELRVARTLGRVSTWAPRFFFNFFPGNERGWKALCRIIRGEKTYVSIKQELGPFQFLFDLLAK